MDNTTTSVGMPMVSRNISHNSPMNKWRATGGQIYRVYENEYHPETFSHIGCKILSVYCST